MAATLSDVAQRVGLARSTVADILRGRPGYAAETRRRTLEAARALDFVPNHFARSLQKQQSHTIGIAGRLRNAVVTGPMLKAIVEALSEHGYMPLFCDASAQRPDRRESDAQAEAIAQLRSRSVDGIILNFGADDAALCELLPPGVPCAPIVSVATQRPSIVIDPAAALRHGTAWLAARGHQRIAFMGVDNTPAMRNPTNSHHLKIKGYVAGMKALGLYDPQLLLDSDVEPGGTRRFVASQGELFGSLTAVLACNDRVALEVISGLADLGLRVPEDCSVVGYDDTEFARAMRPALTTFQPRLDEVGKAAVELVLDLVAGRDAKGVTFAPQLVERDSTRSLLRGVDHG